MLPRTVFSLTRLRACRQRNLLLFVDSLLVSRATHKLDRSRYLQGTAFGKTGQALCLPWSRPGRRGPRPCLLFLYVPIHGLSFQLPWQTGLQFCNASRLSVSPSALDYLLSANCHHDVAVLSRSAPDRLTISRNANLGVADPRAGRALTSHNRDRPVFWSEAPKFQKLNQAR